MFIAVIATNNSESSDLSIGLTDLKFEIKLKSGAQKAIEILTNGRKQSPTS